MMRLPDIFKYWLLTASLLPFYANATECSAKSGELDTPLLELYTSEGCSSCPPADEWFSSLKGTDKVVPLAFHVDYWDYIGWQDRFANPAFTARQKQTAARNGSTFVYTPQVVLNGRDFRQWRQDTHLESAVYRFRQPARGQLGLHLTTSADRLNLQATAQAQDGKDADIYLAIYENHLMSQVNAGENSGRQLVHDYVVREWYGPFPLQNTKQWERDISLKPEWKNRDGGVAAFIQKRQSGEILQALNLKFCS